MPSVAYVSTDATVGDSLTVDINMWNNFSDSGLFNGSQYTMNERQTVEADTKFGMLPLEKSNR